LRWSAALDDGRVAIYLDGNLNGYYELIKNPCASCSYPLLSNGSCQRQFVHSPFLTKVCTIGLYYDYQEKTDYLSKHINNLKKYIDKREPLGAAMVELIRRRDKEFLNCDCVVPVPQEATEFHVDVDSKKEFNQVDELASIVSKGLNIPMIDALVKLKPHKQKSKNFSQRGSETKNLYRCREHGAKNKTVMLLDDITTSGYTLNRCSEELHKAGAKGVMAFVCGINHYERENSQSLAMK
jgi:predicted amidophosphoribosyltransferase